MIVPGGRSSSTLSDEVTLSAPSNHRKVYRLSNGGLTLLVFAIAAVFAAHQHSGLAGDAFLLAMLSLLWFVVSRTEHDSLRPINNYRLTFAELLTLLGLCVIMYGISLPTVSSIPRGVAPASVAPTVATTQDDGRNHKLEHELRTDLRLAKDSRLTIVDSSRSNWLLGVSEQDDEFLLFIACQNWRVMRDDRWWIYAEGEGDGTPGGAIVRRSCWTLDHFPTDVEIESFCEYWAYDYVAHEE